MSARLPSWLFRRYWWAYLLLGVVILVVVVILTPFDPDNDKEVSLSRFGALAEAGEVISIRVDDNDRDFKFKVTTSNETYKTTKEREVPLRQLLLDSGLTNEEINGIDIAVKGSDSTGIAGLVISFLPIIVVLVILFPVLRMALNPQRLRAQMMGLVTNVDPVCKETVNPGSAAGSSTFQGITYYFCSFEHKERFDTDPVRYLLQK